MSAPVPPPRRILVVDDEPQVCEAIKMLLQFDGHTVVTASGGDQALELLAREPFDLVLTDFSMPDMKGDELVRRIKASWPNQRITMITAYAELLGKAPDGVDMVIDKPFRLADLRAAVAYQPSVVGRPQ